MNKKQTWSTRAVCIQMQAAMAVQLQSCGILKGLQDKADDAFAQMRQAYDTGISGVVTISDGSEYIQADFTSNIDNDYCIENLSQNGVQLDLYSVGGESYFSVSSSGMSVTVEGDIQQVFDEFGGQDEQYANIEIFKELVCPTNLIKLDRRKSTNIDFNDSDGTFTAKYTTEMSNIFGEHTMSHLEEYFDESKISELVVVYQFDSKTLDLESIQVTDENDQFDLASYEIKKTNTPVVIPESVKTQARKWNDDTDNSYNGGYDYSDNYQSDSSNDLDYGYSDDSNNSSSDSYQDNYQSEQSDGDLISGEQDVEAFVSADDMANLKATDGIFFPGQELTFIRFAVGDQAITLNVDTLDQVYNKLQKYGAVLNTDLGSPSVTITEDNAYIFINGQSDSNIVNYVSAQYPDALQAVYIPGYEYGDTLSSFVEKHGEPAYVYKQDSDSYTQYTYYYCNSYGQSIELDAPDGNTIAEVRLSFYD